jgi:hypothetical protein
MCRLKWRVKNMPSSKDLFFTFWRVREFDDEVNEGVEPGGTLVTEDLGAGDLGCIRDYPSVVADEAA